MCPAARPRHRGGGTAGRLPPDRDDRGVVRSLHALGGHRPAGRRPGRGYRDSVQRRRIRRRCRPAARRNGLHASLRRGRERRARIAGRSRHAPGPP
ncbi:MAG: hypothetical protein EPO10_27940 [Reyranella sp.]|nr:MAG: hypothetical protein EPO10_27940 [Reyranella sp.]